MKVLVGLDTGALKGKVDKFLVGEIVRLGVYLNAFRDGGALWPRNLLLCWRSRLIPRCRHLSFCQGTVVFAKPGIPHYIACFREQSPTALLLNGP